MDEKLTLEPIVCLHCKSKKYFFLQFANQSRNQPQYCCLDCRLQYTNNNSIDKKKTKNGDVANATLIRSPKQKNPN